MKLTQIQLMLGVSALAGSIGLCGPSAAQQSPIERGAMLKNICVQTLKVGHSAMDLDACTSSLSDALSLKLQISRDTDIERHCSTSGILKCEINDAAANSPAEPTIQVTELFGMPHVQVLGAIADFGLNNYYGMSFDTKRHQEEEACTQIGVDPEISGCAASLDAALSAADQWNP